MGVAREEPLLGVGRRQLTRPVAARAARLPPRARRAQPLPRDTGRARSDRAGAATGARSRSRCGPPSGGARSGFVAAAVGAYAAYFSTPTVDWDWELPAVDDPCALLRRSRAHGRRRRRRAVADGPPARARTRARGAGAGGRARRLTSGTVPAAGSVAAIETGRARAGARPRPGGRSGGHRGRMSRGSFAARRSSPSGEDAAARGVSGVRSS